MSDQVETETTTDEGAKPELGEGGVAALKAEREARKAAEKAASDFAAKVKEFEDRDKSDSERLQSQLDEFKSRAERAERDAVRLGVIAKHSIPEDYQDLIRGEDEASLTVAATKVRALVDLQKSPDRGSFVVADEGGHPDLALNGDGLEAALKTALGIK